jgi:hypothetical protein
MPAAKTTTDHDEIRKWVEERGGKPAAVKGTGGKKDPGIIRVRFPGYGDDSALKDISWEEFFQKFDENELAFLYQETKAGGERSTFNKFVKRETVSA